MKLRTLSFQEHATGWTLESLTFREGLNLFVGASGAGKSRIFNVISNLGKFVSGVNQGVPAMNFDMGFEHQNIEYLWTFRSRHKKNSVFEVESERIVQRDHNGAETKELIFRDDKTFFFLKESVPKLSRSQTAIALFKEEDAISPISLAFERVLLRSFYAEELKNAVTLGLAPPSDDEDSESAIGTAHREISSINIRLKFLAERHPKKLAVVIEQFKVVFPFVADLRVREATSFKGLNFKLPLPIAEIKEKSSNTYIPITDISSGMQKVLLLIVDTITQPVDELFLIEEYENSLGINAIDFFPTFISEHGHDRQVLMTSHHPNIINSVPISEWFVVNRSGTNIRVIPGTALQERYGISKHKHFTQLINDPIYREGVL